jgi:hypothetical protein
MRNKLIGIIKKFQNKQTNKFIFSMLFSFILERKREKQKKNRILIFGIIILPTTDLKGTLPTIILSFG